MIGKIKKGKSFGGCIRYVMGKDNAEIIASDGVLLGSNREMIDSFNCQCLLNPKIKQPLGHIALSFKPEDAPRLSDEFMAKIALEYMDLMGIKNTQFILVRHHNTDNPHCHLVYNRINYDGKVISSQNDFKRNEIAIKRLKDKYGLTYAEDKSKTNVKKLHNPERVKYEIHNAVKGCLERIEIGIIELQKAKTSAANPIVRNEDNTALVQEIKTAVDSCNKERLEETNAKLTKFIKAIFNDYARIFNQMDVLIKKEHPDFEGVKQQLAEAIDKMDEIKVKHNIDEKRHSFALYTKESWILLSMIIILMAAGASAIYHLSRPNVQRDDDSLKYRYIKMKGDASAEQIATLEDIFELNRDNQKIEQIREDVETYEEAVRKQAALAEQARLKEQAAKEQETKAKSIKNKQDDSKVNLNNKSKP